MAALNSDPGGSEGAFVPSVIGQKDPFALHLTFGVQIFLYADDHRVPGPDPVFSGPISPLPTITGL